MTLEDFTSSKYDMASDKIRNSKKSLKNWCLYGYGKAVGVITDKQYVILTEDIFNNLFEDFSLHKYMFEVINTLIYNRKIETYDAPEENVYYDTIIGNHTTTINLSYEKSISSNQYLFICKILDEIDEYNKLRNDKIEIYICSEDYSTTYNIENLKEKIQKDINPDKTTDDVRIIGHTQDDDKKLIYKI